MSRNLYSFYSADGTFYPKNVTIENFTSGPQVIETMKEGPNMNSFRYFKLKTGDRFLKVFEETVNYDKKGSITTYKLIESDSESSIFTYDNKFKRILTTNVSENVGRTKSIRVTNTGLVIIGIDGGSQFTAEESAGVVPNLRNGNIVLNLIDVTDKVENLTAAQGAVDTATTAFKTAQDDLTDAQGLFDTAEAGTLENAQRNLTAVQDAFETAQGNLTDAQAELTAAQTALENA